MIAEYTKLNKKIDDVLIPVKARRYLDDISWSRGDVPSSVKLKLGYYQKDAEHKEILYAELVFSDYMQGSEFGNTATYNFTFEFSALDWVDVFDYDGFNPQAYIWLLFLASGLIFGSLFFAFLIPGLIFCPVKLKPKGFVYILNQIFHSLIGFFIILIPLSIEVWLLWSFFV